MRRIQRRNFLIAGGSLLAAALAAEAQHAAKVDRIGYLTGSWLLGHLLEAFRQILLMLRLTGGGFRDARE